MTDSLTDTRPKQADTPRKGGEKTRLRTLADIDRRTRAGQETFQLRDDLAADLGGWDRLSTQQRILVDRVAFWGAVIRDRAAAYLAGEAIDLIETMTFTNGERRLLADLGLERRAANITPSLQQYLAGKERSA